MVQWLRPGTSTAGDMGLIPGWGTKILHPTWILHPTRCMCGHKKEKKDHLMKKEKMGKLHVEKRFIFSLKKL